MYSYGNFSAFFLWSPLGNYEKNFERLHEIKKEAYAENLSCLSHWKPRNLPRPPSCGQDDQPFWSSQMWWHFLTHAKHFEGECSFVLKGGSGIHFYTDLHFTTTSKEVKKGNYLIVHWNYKTVIFSMTSWLHFHNLFSKGNLGTFMILCGTKLEFSAPLSTTLCQKAGVSEISTFYYYIFT